MSLLRTIKRGILKSRCPPSRRLEFLNALLAYGKWLREHPAPFHYATREDLYTALATKLNGAPFDFLEAGVFQGDSMRRWITLSDHPETRYFGFDTFTGLPEVWHTGLQSFAVGHFDVGGQPPTLDDPRVQFIKGRFQDTLPGFLQGYQPQGQVVVHCDADLYSSTLYVLTQLHQVMGPGTYLLFDNFSVATHDFRAFCDYVSAYGRAYDVVGTAETDYEKVAVQLK